MYIEPEQLKKGLVDSALVSRADIDAAIKEATEKNKTIGDILISNAKISEDDFRRVQAKVLAIPFVDLKKEKLEFSVLSLIPEPIARNHNIVAYKKTDDSLEVAMLDPSDLEAIDFIKKKTNLKIFSRLTTTESIKNALVQYQKTLKVDFGDIIQEEASNLKTNGSLDLAGDMSGDDLRKMADDSPVIRIVDTLLKHAVLQDVSDIHIEQMESEVIVRYRIDGTLHDAMILPKNAGSSITARIKVLSNLKLDEKRLPQDGRFKIEINGEKVSFRVSILPTNYGEKTVMRLLRENVSGFTLEKLGFHGRGLELLHQNSKMSHGFILVTGPTGSGKSTTLYTILDLLNTPDVNISTIEDPIEYQMKRINQTQVKPEIGFTFANGLRSLMRQDPDIIMVGEIRDSETASLGINAALTGHLVLSTLHTNSAAGAIPRLIDMHCEPFLLVSTLSVVVAQRLVRKLADVKEKYFLTADEIAVIGKRIDLDRVLQELKNEDIVKKDMVWEKIPFYRAVPVSDTDDGFKSRIGIHEVLKITPTIKDIVIKGGTSDAIEAQARKEGMLTMFEDGIFKCVLGLTTIEEVLRADSE